MSYGNGLMHVGNAGRSYLHHTGGMVSFSSSFHVDVASGVGAFASSTLSAFAEYRPRLLTRFAVDALTNALAGQPLAVAAAARCTAACASELRRQLFRARTALSRSAPGTPLTIVANGQSAPLQPWGGDLFRTTHPVVPPVLADVRADAAAPSPARAGDRGLLRQGAAGAPHPRTRRSRSSPGAMSTTIRGSAPRWSSSAAASSGSAPKRR